MQASPPGLPFVSSIRRFIVVAVDARLLEGFGVGSGSSSASFFAAAETAEHDFHPLFEAGHIGDVCWRNAAAAKNADVRKRVEVGRDDRSGLHAAHRQAG